MSTVPSAKKIPHTLEKHGDKRLDPYYWMNKRDTPEVLAYLKEENDYYLEQTQHTQSLQEDLFSEMRARIKEDDTSVPFFKNGYWYLTRFETGKEYPLYSRKKESLEAPEEILFDCNQLAENHEYFHLGSFSISPNNKWAVFSTDYVSRRQYTLYVKNLETEEVLKDSIQNTTGSACWAADNNTIFYTKKNPETLRSEAVYRYQIEEKQEKQVYLEADETFDVFVSKSRSSQYIVIGSSSTLTSEYRFIESDKPLDTFKLFSKRIRGVEYDISHYGDYFYIMTNKDDATNFKVMRTLVSQTKMENWEPFIEYNQDVLIEDFTTFLEYYVLTYRENGLTKVQINAWDGSDSYLLPFDNETYSAYVGTNPEFDSLELRYGYTSLIEPNTVISFHMKTREKKLLKQVEVLGGKFDSNNYIQERLWANAEDGTQIPISLVYHKDTPLDGTSPLLQYGYGSYGHTIDPSFSSIRLSLLDRGFIYAIAHIRGSEYLGRAWYESGKLLQKRNTFTDFIDCSKYLIKKSYTASDKLFAYGGSAGGLLMGAIMNMEGTLYKGVIANVPFVDVVTTMLDDSIPLTTGEYDEWGNPNEEKYYSYMKSYSPYDHVNAQEYPNTLVLTGYHDSQVQYWEPAKWVAKLRELKTDHNKLLFTIDMDAGHGGASGRFEALKEVAKEYAFLLDLAQ